MPYQLKSSDKGDKNQTANYVSNAIATATNGGNVQISNMIHKIN